MIYLDNAATSFYRPDTVAKAVSDAIMTMGNSSRGTHSLALQSSRIIFEGRQMIADLFGAKSPEQVAFTKNSTEALNIAIKGILKPGDRAVTTVLEHNSVLRPLYEMEERGVLLTIIGCEPEKREQGKLDYEALEKAIMSGVKAVICTHASNLTGNTVDIHRIGNLCKKTGAIFIVDASQTAGIFPIDMERDGIDIICFTGHKSLMGPQGIGGLCVREGVVIEPLLSGGSGILTYEKKHPRKMPTALEAGTLNGHAIAGLIEGIRYLNEQGIKKLRESEQELMWMFYEELCKMPGIKIYGDFQSRERAPIVSCNFFDEESGEISDYLAEEYEIYTRFGGHCAPLMHESLGTREQGAVRFSFSHFNTKEQVRKTLMAVREIYEQLLEQR
ncbi:MAG: aminotransferase class V-fold PLP-dependent enzyme [Lachnospiraceae bacterium]